MAPTGTDDDHARSLFRGHPGKLVRGLAELDPLVDTAVQPLRRQEPVEQLADSCGMLGLPLFTWSVTDGIRRASPRSVTFSRQAKLVISAFRMPGAS